MVIWGWLVPVYALAVARLTGLIVADDLTRPARDALQRHCGRTQVSQDEWLPAPTVGGELAATLGTCPWCVSIWLAAVVAPLAWWLGSTPWVAIPAFALAFSFVAGALSNLGRS